LKESQHRVDTVFNRKGHGNDAMAKTSTGRATTAKTKSAPRPVHSKKAKAGAAKPGKVEAKKAPAKKAAPPKMAAAPKKAARAKGTALQKAASQKKVHPRKEAVARGKAPAPKQAPPRKPAARKAAAPAKVAAKKAVARRPAARTAVPTPAARRARTVALPRKAPTATARKAPAAGAPSPKTHPPQKFTVSHLSQDDFKTDGLRLYAKYRDLGVAAATGGLCQAHVIRFIPPCTDEVRKRHVHEVDLQLVYVLQGWMKNEFEGHGEQMMSAGSCWLQPAGIKHTVLDYSPDCEVLEIIVPADFKTEELV
jgi:uncharacterized RmlC-like cupin family protein